MPFFFVFWQSALGLELWAKTALILFI